MERAMLRMALAFLLVLAGVFSANAADEAHGAPGAEASSGMNIEEAARAQKKAGDEYASKGDYKAAAGFFVKALSISRDAFTIEERRQLAVYLSWGGRHRESIEEFRSVIGEDPGNTGARIGLARVLSWSGDLSGALDEIGSVLKDSPGNKEALLVKASILRWKGKTKEAASIYNSILREGEDFDARAGLGYALLAEGDRKGAKESLGLLRPSSPYQEKERAELAHALRRAAGPLAEASFRYYNDSDLNQARSQNYGYTFWADNIKLSLRHTHIDAQDKWRNNDADLLSASAGADLAGRFSAGGGLGLSFIGNGEGTAFLTGHMHGGYKIEGGNVGASVSREALTDTALLINNAVRATNFTLSFSKKIKEALTVWGSYSFRDYSDDNSASDVQITPLYAISASKPRLSLGYRFRYLNFERQSGGGYFDPEGFISNQIFLALFYERGRFYGQVEPYAGHQSYGRYGTDSSNFFSGGLMLAGYNVTGRLAVEAALEGGNSAIETAAGFKYYLLGLKVTYRP